MKRKIIEKKLFWLLPVLIVFLAIFVRISPIIEERDYWYDEAFTGILLQQPFLEMNQMIFDDVHPPLYYWLAKPWSFFFDYSSFGIRSFSLFFGVLSVISLFWIGWKMFGERAGLLASILGAFSPFAIQYSQEARMYSLFGFLMLWAVWFFYQALKNNKTKNWIFWGIFAGLSFLTHYLSLFFFVIFYFTYIFYRKFIDKKDIFHLPFSEKSKEKGAVLFGERNFWLGVGIIFLFFLSWIKIFIPHILKGNLGWIGVSYLSDLLKTLQIFLFGHLPGVGGVPEANVFREIAFNKSPLFDGSSVGLFVAILMVIFFMILWKKNRKRGEFLILSLISIGTLILLILLSYVNIKLYVSRYFMPAAIIFYLLFAGMVVEVFKNRWSWLLTIFLYTVLIFFLKPIAYQSGFHFFAESYREGVWGEDYIITSNPFEYTSARYYFGKDRIKYYNRNNPAEDFSGWVVVGNENRIENKEDLLGFKENGLFFDKTCDWEEVDLREVGEFGEYKVCRIR